MKNTILALIGLLMLSCGNLYSEKASDKTNPEPGGTISILSTPGLFNLTTRLAGEYNSLNPGTKINIVSSEYINEAGFNKTGTNSGFISGDQLSDADMETMWMMTIGREVIVPVINSKNPFINELYRQGISAEKFTAVFQNPGKHNWGSILPEGKTVAVNLYILNDESVIAALKNFLNLRQLPDGGIKMATEAEMIAAIQNDPYAVGFCKLSDIIRPDKQSTIENISLLPIDKNGNGKIDQMEQIYDNPDLLSRGAWIGKYPKALCIDLYYVSSSQPTIEAETAFIKWILSDGQQFLNAGGYSDLVFSERQSKLDKINADNIVLPSEEISSFPVLTVIILSCLIILSLIISVIIYNKRSRKAEVPSAALTSHGVFSEGSVIAPKGLYFDKSHTWAFMEKNGMVRIGIDDFIQHVTGPVTRLELKMSGDRIKKGDICLSIIQRGKQLNIYAPVSGIIREQNNVLLSDPSLINSSPYSEGWIYMIEPSNWLREIQFYDMAEKYRKWLQIEFTRLKDFLATSIKVNKLEYERVVLQDGGVLKDSILEDLGPEVWEDFQTNFLDMEK